jgi:hypothetical protein
VQCFTATPSSLSERQWIKGLYLRTHNNSEFGNLFGWNSCMHCAVIEQMLVKLNSKGKYLTHKIM